MGELPVDPFVEWLERAWWPGEKSLRARPESVRLLVRLRWRNRRELRGGRGRKRDRRLDCLPVVNQWNRRYQAHARIVEQVGYHTDCAQPGHGRADDAHRRRRRTSPHGN